MSIIRPFKGIRPRADLASAIAALPYDVYNREEALKEVEREPLSFLANRSLFFRSTEPRRFFQKAQIHTAKQYIKQHLKH